jgi:hypothetical protein
MIHALDLFMGDSEDRNSVLWLETVEGLTEAQGRLRQIARDRPGQPYFVFDLRTQQVVLRINTPGEKRPAA